MISNKLCTKYKRIYSVIFPQRQALLEKYESNYPLDCEMHWAFCKYFWEAHPGLPHINIENLEEIII